MKRICFTWFLLLSIAACAQSVTPTRFLGIPVDGTKKEMIQKIKDKGFIYDASQDVLAGEFNGRDVIISVLTNNNKVYRVVVVDAEPTNDEAQAIRRYNTLLYQFSNNDKYLPAADNEAISETEDISYEMKVHNKQYDAAFYQRSDDDSDSSNRFVWFRIVDLSYAKYSIIIFYDNLNNQANGEDL